MANDGIDFDFFDDSDGGDRDDAPLYSKPDRKSPSHTSHSSSRASSANSKRLIVKANIPTPTNHSDSDTESSDSEAEVSRHRNNRHSSNKDNSPTHSKTNQKPPRPQSSKNKSSNNRRAWQHGDNNETEASISLRAPGSTYYTSDGRKMRKGRCTYSDEELSHSGSDDEEVRISYNSDRSPTPRRGRRSVSPTSRSQSRSPRSRSRSRSNSSQWSTGSEGDTTRRGRSSSRPHTRLTHRRSDSEASSISVSSLSDNEQPERQSQVISESRGGPRSALKSSDTVDKDQLNLKLLLSALLEADQESQSYHHYTKKHVSIHSPPSASRSSGGQRSRGQRGSSRGGAADGNNNSRGSGGKANFTFSTDRARMIDMENQRLLNNILSQRASTLGDHKGARIPDKSSNTDGKKPKAKSPGGSSQQQPARMTPATLNRMREQQRIERENLAMLRRLNQVKPSAEINRAKQLDDYHRQISYYCPELRTGGDFNATLDGPPRRSKSSQGFTAGGTGRRSRPSSAGTARAASAYGNTSHSKPRPSSATNRPSSAANRPTSASYNRPSSATMRKKPEWQTGW